MFTRCYMGSSTREFAARWTGEGVDTQLVDPRQLKRVWLGESPPAPTAALLQSAWLAGRAAPSSPTNEPVLMQVAKQDEG